MISVYFQITQIIASVSLL